MERPDFGLRPAVKLDIDRRGDVLAPAVESLGDVVALTVVSVVVETRDRTEERVLQHLGQKRSNSKLTLREPRFSRGASDPVQNWFQQRELALDTAADAPPVSSSGGGRP